ncbi:MAG TPA: pyridoxal 5'-phosphate synthase glutaminase subunit PdxT [Candidatus Limnocylindrales bacterium]|nr:pyridoxal 5'-phosphate synthase glutaminase subunit PdxT [Candidatus Limnocylindrales bacterium]
MIIGVLSVQGAVSEHLHQLKSCGAEAVAVRNAASLAGVCGLIIPGGESTTIGKLIELFGLTEAIRERYHDNSLALFGTCAGMILLAREVVDGIEGQPGLKLMDITVRRNAFGRQRDSFEAPVHLKTFDSPITGVFIRAPIIDGIGQSVDILASLPEGIVAARQDRILVTSFHPELTDDLQLHQYFLKMCEQI